MTEALSVWMLYLTRRRTRSSRVAENVQQRLNDVTQRRSTNSLGTRQGQGTITSYNGAHDQPVPSDAANSAPLRTPAHPARPPCCLATVTPSNVITAVSHIRSNADIKWTMTR